MRICALLGILLFSCIYASAQKNFKRNDIYLEALGNGLFASVNYERQLTKNPGLGFRIGIGVYGEESFYITFPIGINYLFALKNGRSFIEGGLGATWAKVDGKIFVKEDNPVSDNFTNFIPSIGYRRHTKHSLMWRVNVCPVINKYGGTPWIGLSIGKRF